MTINNSTISKISDLAKTTVATLAVTASLATSFGVNAHAEMQGVDNLADSATIAAESYQAYKSEQVDEGASIKEQMSKILQAYNNGEKIVIENPFKPDSDIHYSSGKAEPDTLIQAFASMAVENGSHAIQPSSFIGTPQVVLDLDYDYKRMKGKSSLYPEIVENEDAYKEFVIKHESIHVTGQDIELSSIGVHYNEVDADAGAALLTLAEEGEKAVPFLEAMSLYRASNKYDPEHNTSLGLNLALELFETRPELFENMTGVQARDLSLEIVDEIKSMTYVELGEWFNKGKSPEVIEEGRIAGAKMDSSPEVQSNYIQKLGVISSVMLLSPDFKQDMINDIVDDFAKLHPEAVQQKEVEMSVPETSANAWTGKDVSSAQERFAARFAEPENDRDNGPTLG